MEKEITISKNGLLDLVEYICAAINSDSEAFIVVFNADGNIVGIRPKKNNEDGKT